MHGAERRVYVESNPPFVWTRRVCAKVNGRSTEGQRPEYPQLGGLFGNHPFILSCTPSRQPLSLIPGIRVLRTFSREVVSSTPLSVRVLCTLAFMQRVPVWRKVSPWWSHQISRGKSSVTRDPYKLWYTWGSPPPCHQNPH